jgi:cell division protease FtsH
MTGSQHRDEKVTGEAEVLAILRPLARRAVGMSGADIERLVREARQLARRQRRSLSWQDIEERLVSGRAVLPHQMRWRMAVHEAGHAVARLALGYDGIEMITIDDPGGGFVLMQELGHVLQLEGGIVDRIVVLLAGRRSEIAFFGSAFAGAGGHVESDLGTATTLALSLETSLGYGRHQPLLFLPTAEPWTGLAHDGKFAGRVNARLEEADRMAAAIVEANRDAIAGLAKQVTGQGTLEGEDLARVLATVRQRLVRPTHLEADRVETGLPHLDSNQDDLR